ncbi:hypothetical protein O0I10_003986 [Lichtheimia ornata]|uniref:Uncharacterized protein n=1 Tax=Lichtheimia ornata TaxID=688661 RepID=A0AAD7Y2A4_9FUNG|nr:uncharacterized protein O0I10_003986 [Lichtheimia ornata]KAJ8660127.1 hypothetical protein O0I10_003986 [Lichtheimia ornata]
MSIPVEVAASMFAPQPVRATKPPSFLDRRRSSTLNKDMYLASMRRPSATPSVISNFFQGWSNDTSNKEPHLQSSEDNDAWRRSSNFSNASVSTTDSDASYSSALSSGMVHPTQPVIDRPHHPTPAHQRRLSMAQQSQDDDDDDDVEDDPLRQHAARRSRADSVQIGIHINDLLKNEDVKEAVDVLKEAVYTMSMTDLHDEHDNEQVVTTYSTMLRTLCEPKMARITTEISGIDLEKNPDAVYDTIIWRMFAKVVEAGYTLETSAYVAVVQYLVDVKHEMLALQAIYSMPRPCWDIQVYRLAISLHLLQTPKQIDQAEYLIGEFGKPYIDLANPLAPTMLPPIRIETPLMAKVTEQDRFKLWMFYQNALSGTKWAYEREEYERKNVDESAAVARSHRRRNSILQDWAERRVKGETNQERILQDKIDNDNAMMYTALQCQQYEYAWDLYKKMGAAVDEFTPRVAMHVCWRAFGATPIMTHVSRRSDWEARAWTVYTRFMCTEYMVPDQPEMPGFLEEMLLLATFAPARAHERYDKVFSVYDLLLRLQFDHLLSNEQVVIPMLCTLLLECRGSPAAIVETCSKAFSIWRRKKAIDNVNHVDQQEASYAIPWALLVLCYKSGSINDFAELIESLLPLPVDDIPTSLLAPIQAFHDKHLLCESSCYFHKYIFRPVQFIDGDDPEDDSKEWCGSSLNGNEDECLDTFGFICHGDKDGEWGKSVQHADGDATASGPIAFVDHALHQRTNIADPNANMLAMAAALGAGQDECLQVQALHCSSIKAKSLIRHCFDVVSHKHK